MCQLKNLAIMLIYIGLALFAVIHCDILTFSLVFILIIYKIKINYNYCYFNKIIKEQTEKQRKCFIDSLNHDLRIPTIAQIRALELLKNKNFGNLNDTQMEMLTQIEDSCKCILNLLSLMINTYSIENNSYKFTYEKFNLSEVIISCFNELLPQATEKQITFEYDGKIKNMSIIADKNEIKKVILNVLSASLLNSSNGEKVSVSISLINNKIRLTFAGNKSCYLSDILTNSNYTPVGQTIRIGFCKKIIENHKGKILKSDNNFFSFEIPVYSV